MNKVLQNLFSFEQHERQKWILICCRLYHELFLFNVNMADKFVRHQRVRPMRERDTNGMCATHGYVHHERLSPYPKYVSFRFFQFFFSIQAVRQTKFTVWWILVARENRTHHSVIRLYEWTLETLEKQHDDTYFTVCNVEAFLAYC